MPSNDLYTLYQANLNVNVPTKKPLAYSEEKSFEYGHKPYVDEFAATIDELDGASKDFTK